MGQACTAMPGFAVPLWRADYSPAAGKGGSGGGLVTGPGLAQGAGAQPGGNSAD